jgi:hypothetical protein
MLSGRHPEVDRQRQRAFKKTPPIRCPRRRPTEPTGPADVSGRGPLRTDLGWAPKGLRPGSSGTDRPGVHLSVGPTSPHDGVLDTLILPEVNAEALSLFLAEVAERHLQDYILMMLDGAGCHRLGT